MSETKMSRKEDLESLIRNSYEIIRENDQIIQTSSEPRERKRLDRENDEQWKLIKTYQVEYLELLIRFPDTSFPSDIEELIPNLPTGRVRRQRQKILEQLQALDDLTSTIYQLQQENAHESQPDKRLEIEQFINQLEHKRQETELVLDEAEDELRQLVKGPKAGVISDIQTLRSIQSKLNRVDANVNEVDEIVEKIPKSLVIHFDQLSERMDILENNLLAAIKSRRFEEAAELGEEIIKLEKRQRRKEKLEIALKNGGEHYERGMELSKTGDDQEAIAEFEQAERHYRDVLSFSISTDAHMNVYLNNLGNSMAMQGKIEEAIPFYERALQISPQYESAKKELAKRYAELGRKHNNENKPSLAVFDYELARLWMPETEYYKEQLAIALCNAGNAELNELGERASFDDWDRSLFKMIRAVYLWPNNKQFHENLKTMQKVRKRPEVIINSGHKLIPVKDLPKDKNFVEAYYDNNLPQKIVQWLELFLPEFSELAFNPLDEKRHPIHFWWIVDTDTAKKRFVDIGLDSNYTVSIAFSHYFQEHHYIVLNSAYFLKFEEEVHWLGVLFHELAHESWKSLGGAVNLPRWSISRVTHLTNERITDLLVIYKGLGDFLLESRKGREEEEGVEADYPALTSIEIARLLRRNIEVEAKKAINLGANLIRQEEKDRAIGHFAKAINIWKWIVQQDPHYAFGWFQLSVAHSWIGEDDIAVREAQIAASLDNNQKYRARLNNQQFSREKEAREYINKGSKLKNKGKVKAARRLFRRAEAIWQEIVDEYYDVGKAHRELGLCYEWQDRIPEAINEFKLAVALDRTNENYANYLRKCLEKYSTE